MYDLVADPYEVHNLADSPRYRGVLKELRGILNQWIEEIEDRGAIPEDPKISKEVEQKLVRGCGPYRNYSEGKKKIQQMILELLKNKK